MMSTGHDDVSSGLMSLKYIYPPCFNLIYFSKLTVVGIMDQETAF